MGIRFNADEVLAMAERIEEQGARFYRRAAELRAKPDEDEARAFLLGLAASEDTHQALFAAMRRDLPDTMRETAEADPYMEAALYLQAAADGHGGEGAPEAAAALTGRESLQDILRTAIGLEQQSILFYLGLKSQVPPELGANRVDAIINEEKSHLVTLTAELRKRAV